VPAARDLFQNSPSATSYRTRRTLLGIQGAGFPWPSAGETEPLFLSAVPSSAEDAGCGILIPSQPPLPMNRRMPVAAGVNVSLSSSRPFQLTEWRLLDRSTSLSAPILAIELSKDGDQFAALPNTPLALATLLQVSLRFRAAPPAQSEFVNQVIIDFKTHGNTSTSYRVIVYWGYWKSHQENYLECAARVGYALAVRAF
jgi:hypothetical protein